MRIGVNCGHTVSGTAGCGAVGYIDESVETRRVGLKLEKLLSQAGHTVYDCTDDYAKSENDNLNKIVAMANKQSLDLFVSIHFNKHMGQAHGTEVCTYSGQRHAEAVNVCNALNALGFRDRGIKDGSKLAVVHRTNAKAMLIEVCFVDNKADVELYQEIGAERIAQAICEAITGTKFEEETQMKIKDINGHWAEKSIQKLIDYGIVNGDEQGNFKPDKSATKAEVAQMIAGALTICGK